MNAPSETIVALSSPVGSSPRAIVRLSGPRALQAALALFHPRGTIGPRDTYRWYDGCVSLDCEGFTARVPAVLFLMRAPRSYTREDVVELHVAGNAGIVGEVIAGLCRAGARAAGPGEFTARAFAAGRIDLAQAEAVMAIVSAGGRRSLAAAQRLLEGRLSREVRALAGRLRDLAARVELAIDFSEEDVPIISPGEAADAARALRDDVVALSRRSREVAHLDGDLRVALVGRPNVGKSSLFNRLAGADRALVTDVAGTTRDELRETFVLAGSRFVLSDTAGLADAVADLDAPAGDPGRAIHQAAQQRALAALARAELVLVVVEARRMIADRSAREDVGRLLSALAVPAILVVNKCDLPAGDGGSAAAGRARAAVAAAAGNVRVVATSARTGEGIDALRAAIVETLRLGEVDRSADAPAVAARHRQCLESAAAALQRAAELGSGVARKQAAGEEILALELREALDALGGITGETAAHDVLEEVFSRFCIGK